MTVREFDTPGHTSIRVMNKGGEIRLTAHDRPMTQVEVTALQPSAEGAVERTVIECHPSDDGHLVEVDVPSDPGSEGTGFLRRVMSLAGEGLKVRVVVRFPAGSDLDIMSASADVTGFGTVGGVKAKTASGDLSFDRITGSAQIMTASGDIEFDVVEGDAKLQSVSGDVRGERVAGTGRFSTTSGDVVVQAVNEELTVETTSGDVRIGAAEADCQAKTTSGDISVGRVTQGKVELQAVSGDLRVGVAAGSIVHVEGQSVSGDMRSEIALGDDPPDNDEGDGPVLSVWLKTVSGDATVRRA